MSTPPRERPMPSGKRGFPRSTVPVLGLVIGIVYLGAGWLSGRPVLGASMFGVMAAFAAGSLVAARYSETVRGLLDHRDERISGIDVRATAFAGTAVIVACIVLFVAEVAAGRDGEPYTWLAVVGAVSYLAAIIALRIRS